MKMIRNRNMICLLMATGAMSSCAPTRQMFAKARDFSISDIRPAKVDVVEVREKDLKTMPTGEERLLAFHRSGRFFGFFGSPSFVEPELPDEGALMDGGLLPSLD